MRLSLNGAMAVVAVLMLSVGASIAGAVSGPGANENSKLVYTQEIVAFDLVFDFDEGSQKRFASVAYQLDLTASYVRFCGGQGLGETREVTEMLTVAPDEEGRASGGFTIDSGSGDTICGCGCVEGSLTVDYTNMRLTNLATGHVYRLDPISQTYTT